MRKKKTKTTTKKTTKKVKKDRSREYDSSLIKTIATIIALAFAIFIALSNFSLCGSVGSIVRNIVLSTFGTLGYFFPLIIVLAILVNLFNTKAVSNIKIYSLIFLYIVLICFADCLFHDFSNATDLMVEMETAINVAKDFFSFTSELFSGGIIGTSIVYISTKALGVIGSIILFLVIGIILTLLLFGTGIAKVVLRIIRNIIMFIPDVIKGFNEKREEDRQIALANEEILKKAIAKNEKIKSEIKIDNDMLKNDSGIELPIEKTKKTFDTSNINITLSDIQSRFYQPESKEVKETKVVNEKKDLLNEMKKKSINEIMCEKTDVKPNSFFYDDNMKPVDQLKNIVIPEPRINNQKNNLQNKFSNSDYLSNLGTNPKIMNIDESEENFEIDLNKINNYNKNLNLNNKETKIEDDNIRINYDDNDKFASGLDNIRQQADDDYYKELQSDELLKRFEDRTAGNIEINNSIVKASDDMATREAMSTSKKKFKKYKFPPISLLNKNDNVKIKADPKVEEKAITLIETLRLFGVGASITNITVGPSITRFELKPDLGVKVSKILSLEDDLKLALAASGMRIEAPIPGKSAIGIEIQNSESTGVLISDIISSKEFKESKSKLTVAIGKNISGNVVVADLKKMPHLLIAGVTGSGKSVCINSLITSLMYKSGPEDVRLILIDPKMVELQIYNGIPHLLIPVITDPRKAASSLNWAVNEMTRRFNLIQEKRVRDIEGYNSAVEGEIKKIGVDENNEAVLEPVEKLPYIVIIIDEFADLMMTSAKDVESAIMRIAQLARACGIYLVIATQKPTVNIISGNIKTNVPSRIAFAVSSGIDSQIILDRRGAEKLLGHGDMLYMPFGVSEPSRIQGCFVSEEEILKVVDYIKDVGTCYNEEAERVIEKEQAQASGGGGSMDERDPFFVDAGMMVIEQQNASIGMVQRRFRVGFNRAARIIDQLSDEGVISTQDGKKPREVLMEMDEFINKFGV